MPPVRLVDQSLYPSVLPKGQFDLLIGADNKDLVELGNDALKLSMNSDIACSVGEVGIIIVLVPGRCILHNSVTFNSSMNSWS